MLFLGAMLGHKLCEAVLDPDLMVVSDLTLIKKVEGANRLDKISLILCQLLFREVNLGPLQVSHRIDVHGALDIDTDQHLLTSLWRLHELSED